MDLDIGKLILKKLKVAGMSKLNLLAEFNKSPQIVQDIFTRTSIDTSLLKSISKVLEFNFFTLFINDQTAPANKDITQINDKLNLIANNIQLLIKQTSAKNRQEKINPTCTS